VRMELEKGKCGNRTIRLFTNRVSTNTMIYAVNITIIGPYYFENMIYSLYSLII
jgi:hypothetical protein